MEKQYTHAMILGRMTLCEVMKPVDPRDPDQSRTGIFVNHNCAYCDSGKKPCRQGDPNRCDNPHARND